MVAAAVVGAAVVGSVATGAMASRAQSKAAKTAANAQTASDQEAIAEQQRQFDAMQALLKPYVDAGLGSLNQQQSLLGLNGADAQKQSIDALQNSPQMQAYINQGENAMRQNAAATGGLRGGNFQGALAQYRPNLLNNMIQQQYQNLGGITALGQSSAAGVGNVGMQSANNIGNLLQASGNAQAGAALAQGQAQANMYAGIGNAIGSGLGMYGKMGGLF